MFFAESFYFNSYLIKKRGSGNHYIIEMSNMHCHLSTFEPRDPIF